jgi:hypothetical protein
MAPSSALPIGAARMLSEMQPVLVDPASYSSGLLNSVLALLAPFNPDESERYDEEILDLNVIGFLVVYVFWRLCCVEFLLLAVSQHQHRCSPPKDDNTCTQSRVVSRQDGHSRVL